MEVSKLTISPEILSQTGSAEAILEWMVTHPKQCRNTNGRSIARAMALNKDAKNPVPSEPTVLKWLTVLRQKGIISRKGTSWRYANYSINWYHPELPPSIKAYQHEDDRANGEVVTTKVGPVEEAKPEPEPEPELEPEAEPEEELEVEPELEEESEAELGEEPEKPVLTQTKPTVVLDLSKGDIYCTIAINL